MVKGKEVKRDNKEQIELRNYDQSRTIESSWGRVPIEPKGDPMTKAYLTDYTLGEIHP